MCRGKDNELARCRTFISLLMDFLSQCVLSFVYMWEFPFNTQLLAVVT